MARVQRWCAARVPEHARHQVRVECEVAPRHLTIVERRAPWREDFGPEWTAFPIARLRYTAADKSWTLYWRDRNLRFHLYEPMAPSHRVEDPRHQTAHLPPLRWGQLQPSRRGQLRLTSPYWRPTAAGCCLSCRRRGGRRWRGRGWSCSSRSAGLDGSRAFRFVELAERHKVHRRTVRQALASPLPPPRKQYPPRRRRPDGREGRGVTEIGWL